MTLSPDDLAEMIESARDYLASRREVPCCARAIDFSRALVEVASRCVVGLPCERHCGEVHGQEAEELRTGVAQILGNTASVNGEDAEHVLHKIRESLAFLLDHVDARDSLVALQKPADDVERWQGMQRQLGSLRTTLTHVGLPEVEAAAKDSPKLSSMLIVELAGVLASADGLLRELLREKGLPCG